MGQENQSKRRAIEAEAAAWLARLETGSADRAAFEVWRDADAAHAAAFAQLDAAWSRLDRARALKPAHAEPPDPDLLAPADEPNRSRRWLLRAATFGGVSVLAGGGAALVLGGRAYAETGIGERRSLRLPDGSLLDLNTNSRASWRFDGAKRQVWLERGEAALEIAADTARPFVLNAAGRAVTLDAGVFNARLRADGAQLVALREATINSDVPTLAEGQELRLDAEGQNLTALTPAALDAAGAWRRGEIVFDGDTLHDAVAEYNRYLTRPIAIADGELGDLRLGGRFTTRDPSDFIAAVETAFGLVAEQQPGGAIVLARKQNASAE